MTLSPHSTRPSDRSYVLKLHRSARPEPGALRGRLENLATGWSLDFADGEQLLAALLADLATHPLPTPEQHHAS